MDKPAAVTSETTLIDIISGHRETEQIFRRLEEETGTCVCCEGLFLSLREAAEKFGFDLEMVLSEIKGLIRCPSKPFF
ncbi:MAG: hypothetical protein JW943_12640 [Deltaproteobacteria bacterium]|nr:hypothetical protein [Deltaproteobacteria bacterium]